MNGEMIEFLVAMCMLKRCHMQESRICMLKCILPLSKYQIPDYQRGTQSASSPEYHASCAWALASFLELFVSLPDVLCCKHRVCDKLTDVFRLQFQVHG
jgi:hypothetical protein